MPINASFDKIFGRIPLLKEISLESSGRSSPPLPALSARDEVLCDAGSDLLQSYQVQWSELHRSSQEASLVAETIDRLCFITNQNLLKKQTVVADLVVLVKSLPDLGSMIDVISDDLSKTIACLEELEQVIEQRDETVFQAETRKRFDIQYVLKIHEEKLNREFEKIAITLESDHLKRVSELKKLEENAIRSKQESFKRAFDKELMEYKMSGRIMRPEKSEQKSNVADCVVSLEQIEVEADEEDRLDLEKFLQE